MAEKLGNISKAGRMFRGYLAKLEFWFKIKTRVKILPQAYN